MSPTDNVSINSVPNSSENVNTNNKNSSSGQGKALLISDAMYEDMKSQEQIDEETALFNSVTQEEKELLYERFSTIANFTHILLYSP